MKKIAFLLLATFSIQLNAQVYELLETDVVLIGPYNVEFYQPNIKKNYIIEYANLMENNQVKIEELMTYLKTFKVTDAKSNSKAKRINRKIKRLSNETTILAEYIDLWENNYQADFDTFNLLNDKMEADNCFTLKTNSRTYFPNQYDIISSNDNQYREIIYLENKSGKVIKYKKIIIGDCDKTPNEDCVRWLPEGPQSFIVINNQENPFKKCPDGFSFSGDESLCYREMTFELDESAATSGLQLINLETKRPIKGLETWEKTNCN